MFRLFCTLFLFISFPALAQSGQLTGIVTDASEQSPIDFATVVVKPDNGTQVYGGKSNQQGIFTINDLPNGNYTVSISSIGYTTQNLQNIIVEGNTKNLGTIALENNNKKLKDVVVKGEKPAMEIGIDKKTFNVDKNITSAGGTAADILNNVPSVNVDMDGNLSVRGKSNVTLLVDGKPSSMFGNDPQTALQTIPASSIESIEVITNPSSKYEAQGMNGIVNIILKKDRKPGYNGMLTLGGAVPFRFNTGVNLNANVGKWNLFLNANGRTSKTWEETTNERDNYDDPLTYSSFTHNDRRPLSGFINLGAEYNIDKRNKITLSENIFAAKMKGNSLNTIRNENNYETLINAQQRRNIYTGNPLSSTTNLQYKHTFKDPKEDLNIELNYSKTRYIRSSTFETILFDSNMVMTNGFNQNNPVRGGNWNGTFQIDYTKPLGKNARIDIGERTYYIQFKSENQPTIQYFNQDEQPETILKNKFRFTQQVHGLYANYANQWKKTGIQVGLRGEYFGYEGFVYQYNAGVNNGYFNLFPTLFVSQKISTHEDLNFNYSRRVNRPNFFQLIPFIDVTNPLDTSMGNPGLKPEFIHATEITYSNQFGNQNTFMGSVYYQYTNNLIQRYRRFNPDGTTFSQNQNLATGQTYGLELTTKMNLLKWWDVTLNLNAFRNIIDGSNVEGNLGTRGFGGFAKLVTNAKLPSGWNAQLTGNYNARTAIAQGSVAPYGNIDIALKKSFMKNLVNLTVNATDIFNTLQTETQYNLYPFYNQNVLRKNLTRTIGINLQIRFASKSMRNAEAPKRMQTKKEKEKESKNRDENLKKDEGGGDDNSGGGNNR